MRRAPIALIVGLAGMVVMPACTGHYESDFPVLVINRTGNPIQALANRNVVGEVASGESGSFTLTLPESNANVYSNGTAPTPQAFVTFSAKDTRTGSLSSEKPVTLTQGTSTTVSFTTEDFPDTGPTIARFTFSPTSPTINQDVSFNASSSTVSNGTYAWDFGNGQTGTGVTVTNRFQQGGTFTVTLTVTSDSRQTSTSSRTITVATALPANTANFTLSPTSPGINQDVVFIATTATTTPGPPGGGTPPPGIPPGRGGGDQPQGTTYRWDFGDGITGIGTTVTHRYTRGGTFVVTLRATTPAGLTATQTRQVTVSATLPAGSSNFVFSPTDPRADETVFFNASSSALTNGTYTWDFGDGSGGSGVTVTHRFTNSRTYTVTLTATNELGQTATTSKTVTVVSDDDDDD